MPWLWKCRRHNRVACPLEVHGSTFKRFIWTRVWPSHDHFALLDQQRHHSFWSSIHPQQPKNASVHSRNHRFETQWVI
jgi:hypothetical protein